jgi:hypothetical protein
MLRSIPPTRATTSLAASVDPTEARCARVKGIAPMSARDPGSVGAQGGNLQPLSGDRRARPIAGVPWYDDVDGDERPSSQRQRANAFAGKTAS